MLEFTKLTAHQTHRPTLTQSIISMQCALATSMPQEFQLYKRWNWEILVKKLKRRYLSFLKYILTLSSTNTYQGEQKITLRRFFGNSKTMLSTIVILIFSISKFFCRYQSIQNKIWIWHLWGPVRQRWKYFRLGSLDLYRTWPCFLSFKIV